MNDRPTSLAAAALILLVTCAAGPPPPKPLPPPPIQPGAIVWLEPTRAEVHPQGDAEKQTQMVSGRILPTPELLQPELDAALPAYRPTPGLTIKRTFRAGSSDILPGLVEAWTAAFRVYHPGFQLELARPLAGSLGAVELIKGNLDMVFVSRELRPADVSGFRDHYHYDPLSIPVSGGSWRHFGFLDAVPVIVNPANPVQRLSFAQLDAAFSTTRHLGLAPALTWGDLGLSGAWARHKVHLYGIKPWNGYEEFMRQRVLSTPGHRGEWRGDIHFDETFFNLARRVAADPDALGYSGLSAIDSAVKIVPVSATPDGPGVAPSYEAVAGGRYPLARVTYLNTNVAPGQAPDAALGEFVRFILSREGQAVVRAQAIFLPLRAQQAAASSALLPHP